MNECKKSSKNMVDNRKRNEELISKYQNDEINKLVFVKLISNHYAKLQMTKLFSK